MAGIYLHIPFCKQKCHYCDFHFSTNLTNLDNMVKAIVAELKLRSSYLLDETIDTIYFGGGTPSIIEKKDFELIFKAIYENYQIGSSPEITVECNPDDLTIQSLTDLFELGVNRLSIGIQSFDKVVLTKMNRAHTHQEAIASVKLAKEVGFNNITVDLIYGVPDVSTEYWSEQIKQLLDLNVVHVSAYCLTIEPKTVFGHLNLKGKLNLPADENSLDEFNYLVKALAENGFEQYEISNFSRTGFISKHNSSYWLGKKYLGIGPSAHSYNGKERSWNVRNNAQYLKSLSANKLNFETELLSSQDKVNEYILTRLRTKWGIEQKVLKKLLEQCPLGDFDKELSKHLLQNNVEEREGFIYLTAQGKFIADKIAADLFV